ncbi:MAG: RNA polymerase sigma factor [Bacteroidales bacterium]|nr:RNA polymerase sigma factor [Bacteroidales bacterium]
MTAIEFNYKLIGMQTYLQYFAKKLTSHEEDANDLVQETNYKALLFREKYVHHTNFKAWLFTIMKNIFINNYRRNKKAQTFIDTTDNLHHLNSRIDAFPVLPDSELREQEIRGVVDSLEEEHRIPFVMHTQGFKYKEIAYELDISIGTVKSRIFFSRKKLMDRLEGYGN